MQGAGDLHTLTPTPSLGLTYRKLDRHVEAVELHEALVVGRRQALGEVDLDTLATIHNLARTYSFQNKHTEAVELQEAMLVVLKRSVGEDPATIFQ